MKNKITLLLLVFIPFLLNAQFNNGGNSNSCLTDQLHQKMLNENASYHSKHQELEEQLYTLNKLSTYSAAESVTNESIPVVVHIIHQNGTENLPDEQVFDAIQHLNEAFANVGFYDPGTGVDTEIEFCLAIRDPQNNPSNGINRIESELTNLTVETQDLNLKSLLQWNPLDYLNIWVVNEITSVSAGAGVAGYAYFPSAHGLLRDGIVIEANFFGASQDDSKVLVHEAGHYLGLYHTFEGGCNNDDCQLNGDRICDTPPDQSTAPVDCGAAINTCSTDEDDTSINNPFRPVALGGLGDQNDMYINYMDYGHLPCYSAFTEGQKERMNNVLLMPRKSLLESYGCQSSCPFASFNASFLSNPASPILAGELVTFTNTSNPADCYEWSINGESISTAINTSYTFSEEGFYTINLQIQDTINYCSSSVEETFEVICEGEASFLTTNTNILPGETVDFTNTSTGNIGYQWFLDGALYSTDTDLSITFTDPGYYTIYLVGMTATCLNYSSTVTIIVGTCDAEDKREMHWYFGDNAALDFNSGEPVIVAGSQLNANEGTACISDDNGDLLFYTNGLNIWDSDNNIMSNGSGLMGGANTSAWNQALIVPRPFHPAQYYVFTCDEYDNGTANGVQYSIVDMTLNGGLGDVTAVKNVFLCPANTESMSAVYHKDGRKAWLVISDHEVLNTYLIDSTGIGSAIPFSDPNYDIDWGFTRFFNSGKRLISSEADIFGSSFMVILDFDNVNGTFSNPIEVTTDAEIWSFEVSPDDNKLYCTLGLNNNTFNLYQYDLSLTTASQISSSKTLLGELALFDRLLLAPNGKIYTTVFNTPHLGVINNPNELGTACDFDAFTINFSPAFNLLSLPKFIRGQRYYAEPAIPVINLGEDQLICNGITTVLDPNPANENYDYLWQDGSTDATFTAWLPGTYWVTASNDCGSVTDSITIELEELDLVDLGTDIVLCAEEEVTLDAGTEGDFYLWQDGSNNSTFEATEPGIYWVEVSTESGCYEGDSIQLILDTESPILDCPPNIDTLIPFGWTEVLLNPSLPSIIENCPYTIINNFTNTDNATANYPLGTTTVTWTATDSDSNSASCNTIVTVNISTGTSSLDYEKPLLTLYPNPSEGLFIIEDTQNNINHIELSVFDLLGRKIYAQSAFLQNKLSIDLSKYAKGVYFLRWSTNENRGVFKLVIE